jgi:hypothetical protein
LSGMECMGGVWYGRVMHGRERWGEERAFWPVWYGWHRRGSLR